MIRGILWNWAPWIYNRIEISILLISRVLNAAYNEAIIPKKWLILKDFDIPVYSAMFPNVQDDIVRWSCTTNPTIFISSNLNIIEYKHISYLGFVVIVPGYDSIDLTDWINGVKWSGQVEPTLIDLFTIWCCETGNSYFHLIPNVKIRLITELGDELVKGLNDSPISIRSTNEQPGYNETIAKRSDTDRILDSVFSSSGC